MSTVIRTTLPRTAGDIHIEVDEVEATEAIAAFRVALEGVTDSED